MTRSSCDIFISHAGPDKRKFADVLHYFMEAALRPAHITSFLDEKSLRPSDTLAAEQMLEAAQQATVGPSSQQVGFALAHKLGNALKASGGLRKYAGYRYI